MYYYITQSKSTRNNYISGPMFTVKLILIFLLYKKCAFYKHKEMRSVTLNIATRILIYSYG